jgi:hypothetical protein
MKLLTKEIERKLVANHAIVMEDDREPLKPVVKFFNPTGVGTWLVSDIDEHGNMFGLCDLGMGSPELGYVSIHELMAIQLPFGLSVERDLGFKADKPLIEYANEARVVGYINA